MGEMLRFDYYYGNEAEQFSFYRVPRLLIKDKRFSGLSSDAKLLYGLLLDRMSLSIRNGWFDSENRAYVIYKIESIAEDLGCGKEKAGKVLAELDASKGIGLIEKVRRGLGKPDIIYVKNFVIVENYEEEEPKNPVNITEVGKSDFKKSENPISRNLENRFQEVGESDFSRSENPISGGLKNRLQEIGKSDANYNNTNKTERSKTNLILSGGIVDNPPDGVLADKIRSDAAEEYLLYESIIKDNIEYDLLCERNPYDIELIDELLLIMTDIVSVKRDTVRINKSDYPHNVVKSIFLKLECQHIEYVLRCIKDNKSKIGNIKNYMLTMLYNSYVTYHSESTAYISKLMYENGDKY